MCVVLCGYRALTHTSSPAARSKVFAAINDAASASDAPSGLSVELVQLLIHDLSTCTRGGLTSGQDAMYGTLIRPEAKPRLGNADIVPAILSLKALAKTGEAAEIVATADNLSSLLALSTALKDSNPEASIQALRCIANVLLINERARTVFSDKSTRGGEMCAGILERATSPDLILVAARILFLVTLAPSSFVRKLVEEKHHGHTVVNVIPAKLDALMVGILTGVKTAREAMTDVLKLCFNLILHYPKLSSKGKDKHVEEGEPWSSALDGLLSPLIRLFNTLPATFPTPLTTPTTHLIHVLISIPITATLRPTWIPHSRTSTTNGKQTKRGSSSSSPTRAKRSPQRTTTLSIPSKPVGAVDRALSVLAAGRRSLKRSPSATPRSSSPNPVHDTLRRAYDLLDVTLAHYLPGSINPDDSSVRERCKQEEGDYKLDDIASPLVILITRLSTEENDLIREWMFPVDLDRTGTSLDQRPDLLGRCLRLLRSVHHQRLHIVVGDMLLAISGSDPTTLAELAGYGNVAGFLFNKGIMGAPGASRDTIDPITGVARTGSSDDVEEMTQEEKEKEADKLFDMFDRLDRSGVSLQRA